MAAIQSAAENLRTAWANHTGAEPSESVLGRAIDELLAALAQQGEQHIDALIRDIEQLRAQNASLLATLDQEAKARENVSAMRSALAQQGEPAYGPLTDDALLKLWNYEAGKSGYNTHELPARFGMVVLQQYAAAPAAQQGEHSPSTERKHTFVLWAEYETKIEALTNEVNFHKALSAKAMESPPVTQEITRLKSIIADMELAADAKPLAQHGEQQPVAFDYQTAADFLNGKTINGELVSRFVSAARWAHDDNRSLRSVIQSLRGELAARDAEIAMLKNALMEAEAAPAAQPQCDTARVLEWMRTPNRKAAQLAFTEGPERQAAYWIEIAQGEPAAQPDDAIIRAWQAGYYHAGYAHDQAYADKMAREYAGAAPAAQPLTLDNAPLGTKAPAFNGGHWVRVEHGWKWCTGSTFPRPGGDWTGELVPPEAAPAAQPVSALGIAGIGLKHFGNPIPQAWYGAAKELMLAAAPTPQPDARKVIEQLLYCIEWWRDAYNITATSKEATAIQSGQQWLKENP